MNLFHNEIVTTFDGFPEPRVHDADNSTGSGQQPKEPGISESQLCDNIQQPQEQRAGRTSDEAKQGRQQTLLQQVSKEGRVFKPVNVHRSL